MKMCHWNERDAPVSSFNIVAELSGLTYLSIFLVSIFQIHYTCNFSYHFLL